MAGHVNVFIKRVDGNLFLTASAHWTKDLKKAYGFSKFDELSAYCERKELTNVEAYYSFDNPRFDFTLRLGRSRKG